MIGFLLFLFTIWLFGFLMGKGILIIRWIRRRGDNGPGGATADLS